MDTSVLQACCQVANLKMKARERGREGERCSNLIRVNCDEKCISGAGLMGSGCGTSAILTNADEVYTARVPEAARPGCQAEEQQYFCLGLMCGCFRDEDGLTKL